MEKTHPTQTLRTITEVLFIFIHASIILINSTNPLVTRKEFE